MTIDSADPRAATPSRRASTQMVRRRLTDEVIVATRDRPDDLSKLLETLAVQSRPPAGIVVVDASVGDETRGVVARWSVAMHGRVAVRRLIAMPGLPSQRNAGIEATRADVVHFFDDDVTLDPRYLQVVMERFESDGEVVGVGGLVQTDTPRTPRIWWRLALLDSARPGRLLRSGMNVAALAIDEPLYVDWLSGCAMSYRREIATRVRFDETLAGYALMEDADFGYRAGRVGRLLVDPGARCVHEVSPTGRWSAEQRHRMAVARRGWFVRKNLPRSSRWFFWWSTIAGFVLLLSRGVVARRRDDLLRARWQVLGAWDYVRGVR